MKGKKILAWVMAAAVFMTSGSIAFATEEINTEDVTACGTEEQTEGTFSYTVSDGQATLTKYNGTDETVVEIPETVQENIPVTAISSNLFEDNTTIEKVIISKNLVSTTNNTFEMVFVGASDLRYIEVKDKNNGLLYDIDGVLFRHSATDLKPMFVKYPEGREEDTYIIPDDTDRIKAFAFYGCANLKRIIVPSSVSTVMTQGFDSLTDTTIVFQQTDSSQIDFVYPAFHKCDNCTIIVKNEAMREIVKQNLAKCTNTTVKTESELSAEEQAKYLTPATSLTFLDGSTVKDVTLMPEPDANYESSFPSENEKGYDYYWQDIYYTVSPEYSTDIVTWTSSNSDIAVAKSVNGRSVVMGFSEGNCTITGTTESGKTITLHVVVAIPIERMIFKTGDYYEPDKLENGQTITYDYDKIQDEWGGKIYFNASAEFEPPYSGYNIKPKVTETITGDTDKLVHTQQHRINGLGEEWDDDYFIVKGTGSVRVTETALASDGSNRSWTYTIAVVKTENNNSNTDTDNSTDNNTNMGNNTDDSKDTGSNTGNGANGNKDSNTVKPAAKPSQKITNVSSSYKKAYKTSFTLKPKAKTSCTYKSSNTKIATVNSKGKVTIKGTGKVTITITAKETSKYKKATKKVTIYAIPAKMKTPSVKAGSKKLTVSWKKDSRADGYQIQYSTSSKFKNAKTVTCSKKTAKTIIKKLKKGKKYYVRIRAYKKIGSKKYYGSFSGTKSVKVK